MLHSRIKWDRAPVLYKLVHASVTSAMTRTRDVSRAVQNVLNRQVDIIPGAIAIDFYPIGERRERRVGPARSAILGNVLVQLMRQAALPFDVVPVPLLRQIILGDVAGV